MKINHQTKTNGNDSLIIAFEKVLQQYFMNNGALFIMLKINMKRNFDNFFFSQPKLQMPLSMLVKVLVYMFNLIYIEFFF